jgi:LysM repeat protein
MKLNKIATATLMPATIAGLALAGGIPAHAATTQRQAQDKSSQSARQWVTVRPGDTLSGIAATYHMTWEAVYATPPNAQHLGNPNLLIVGERLRIPADPGLRAAQFRTRYAAAVAKYFAAPAPAPAAPAPASQAEQAPASQAEQAPASQAAAAPAAPSGGSLTSGMSSFEQCVAYRESSDTPTDPDGLFGILPSTWASLGYSGTAGEASVGQQEAAFNQLYASEGAQPWAPYDGC